MLKTKTKYLVKGIKSYTFWTQTSSHFLTRPVLDQFHESSRVVLLICLNLHSVLKAEKVCENVLIVIFAVQMQFFLQYKWYFFGVQENFFWVHSTNFCREFATFWSKFLPPYGESFAALWWEFYRLMARVLPPFGGSFAVLC